MGEGETVVRNYLDAADTRSTLAAIEVLAPWAAGVERRIGDLEIGGSSAVGLRGAAAAAIDVGNAGTLLRLLPGWLAGQPGGEWTFDGDESIRRRPVDRVAEPLRADGRRGRGARRPAGPVARSAARGCAGSSTGSRSPARR